MTRAILLADAARRAARMDARKVTMKEKHWTRRPKREAQERSLATRADMIARGEPKGRWGESDRDRALLALEGGEWLAHSDIGKRAGMSTQRAQWAMKRSAAEGLVECAENEEYAGKPRPGGPVKEQPKFLWRLTRAGKAVCGDIRDQLGQVKPDKGWAAMELARKRRLARLRAAKK
ncbi:MAG TPA: hypothetical protein VIU82_00285 [Bosea sp. (in: a-proteobacteria)]